jgi:hypothetical protein
MIFLLRNVLADYIKTLTERQFDLPLLCILLKNGYYDIHFTHGAFEFGKDFIAKRKEEEEEVQYVIQSKGGNIGLADWGQIRWQIEEARINPLSHPSFDKTLKKKVVLVTTGRLVGGATLSAQQYNERCIDEGQIGFTVWDIDSLLEMMLVGEANPIGLIEETTELLSIIAKIKNNQATFKDLEIYSRNWIERTLRRDKRSFLGVILESSLFTQELNRLGRLTLASYVSLFPIRAIVFALHESNEDIPNWAKDCLRICENHFLSMAGQLLGKLEDGYKEQESIFYNQTAGFHSFIAYPVNCSHIMELIGLLGLSQLRSNSLQEAEKTVNLVDELIRKNTGFFAPISDRYAVSIIPPLLLLKKFNRLETCSFIIKRIAIWLCNRYEQSEFGLASPYASEKEEVITLLGYSYDFIDLSKRRESYLATVLLDMCAMFGFSDLYEDILNDFLAISILPCSIETIDTPGKYKMNSDDAVYTPVVKFKEGLSQTDGWRVTTRIEEGRTFCMNNLLWWELLAISSILRDRHFVNDLKEINSSIIV